MPNKTITFTHFDKLRIFEVEFVSKSRTANVLMSVIMEGFPIDTVELEFSHPLLYRAIRKEMIAAAEIEWSETIPTLAYQNK